MLMSCSNTKACGREEIPPLPYPGPMFGYWSLYFDSSVWWLCNFSQGFHFSLSSHIILRVTITWLQMSWNHQGDKWVSGGGRPGTRRCKTTHLHCASTFLKNNMSKTSLSPRHHHQSCCSRSSQAPFPPSLLHLKATENTEHLTLENIPYFMEFGKGGDIFGFSFFFSLWLLAGIWFIKPPLRQLLSQFIFSVSQVYSEVELPMAHSVVSLLFWVETKEWCQ